MIRESNGVVTAILGSVYQLRGNGRLVPHTQTQTQAQMKAKAEHPISSAQPIFPGQPGEGTIGDLSRPLDLRVRGLGRCLEGWVEGIIGMLRSVRLGG